MPLTLGSGLKFSVRHGVFETNSSSVHAIIIGSDSEGFMSEDDCISYGAHFILPEDFGRDYLKVRGDFDSRLVYLWTAVTDMRGYDDPNVYSFDAWEERIRRVLPDGYDVELVREYNGKSQYIEHSSDLKKFMEALFDDEELLRAFLLGKGSFLVLGSDELFFDTSWMKLKISEKLPMDEMDDVLGLAYDGSSEMITLDDGTRMFFKA